LIFGRAPDQRRQRYFLPPRCPDNQSLLSLLRSISIASAVNTPAAMPRRPGVWARASRGFKSPDRGDIELSHATGDRGIVARPWPDIALIPFAVVGEKMARRAVVDELAQRCGSCYRSTPNT